MVPPSSQADVSEADLLLPFELASPNLDACWRAGLDDMRRITSPDDMLPLSLYIRAHAQTRISADLLFSGCLPEAADLLRTGVESAVHAYRIKRGPTTCICVAPEG